MSVPEILEAVRALPKSDRLRILQTLTEEFGDGAVNRPEETALAEMIAIGAPWQTGSQVTTDAAGMRAILEAVARSEGKG
jgi:hypothetical protein